MLVLAVLIGLSPVIGLRAQELLARNDFNNGYEAVRLSAMVRASDLIGTTVWDQQGHRLGRIEDFLADPSSWRVICALIRPANLYGPREYYVALPARSFTVAGDNRAIVDATITNFIGLPRFPVDPATDAKVMSKALKEVFDRFNQKIYWDEKAGVPRMVRCAIWMGMDVDDQSGVNVGRLTDFLIDLPAERVVFGAVSFFGLDSNTHVMPPGVLAFAPNIGALILEMDDGRVAALAKGDPFLWTKTVDPAWVTSVYHAFGQEIKLQPAPPLDLAVAKARAQRVSPPAPPPPPAPRVIVWPTVPEDPAVAPADLAGAVMTAIIHANPANAGLGLKASANGDTITLSGTAASEEKKRELGRIAESVAGAGKVVNEIQVK